MYWQWLFRCCPLSRDTFLINIKQNPPVPGQYLFTNISSRNYFHTLLTLLWHAAQGHTWVWAALCSIRVWTLDVIIAFSHSSAQHIVLSGTLWPYSLSKLDTLSHMEEWTHGVRPQAQQSCGRSLMWESAVKAAFGSDWFYLTNFTVMPGIHTAFILFVVCDWASHNLLT